MSAPDKITSLYEAAQKAQNYLATKGYSWWPMTRGSGPIGAYKRAAHPDVVLALFAAKQRLHRRAQRAEAELRAREKVEAPG